MTGSDFDEEVRRDIAVERRLFWREVWSVGIVIAVLVVRELWFV